MASIKCGHCQGTHETVREVRQCAMTDGVSAGNIAEKNGLVSMRPSWSLRSQGESPAYAKAVHESREFEDGREDLRALRDYQPTKPFFGETEIPGRHNPRHGATTDQPVPRRTKTPAAEGMYRKAGSIYKVQKAVHGSGRNYAKRLVETGVKDPKTGKNKWRFEYAQGFVYELRPEHALTIEQAKEFGALYGTCCVCGRTLTREESIEAGIGPVCAAKAF